MKKTIAVIVSLMLTLVLAAACGGGSGAPPADSQAGSPAPAAGSSPAPAAGGSQPPASSEPAAGNTSSFDSSRDIAVVSREDGSGTRGSFIEIFGVLHDGVDRTTPEAQFADGTNVVLTSVAGNTYAIGYVSMGALNPTVKALAVDGVDPTVANVNNGTYPVMRPFNIAYQELSDVAQDFYNFLFSEEGQAIVDDRGYIEVSSTGPFVSTRPSGTVAISGSTSVAPVMERLIFAYEELNPNAVMELMSTGSSAGIRDATEGVVDIGMASRELSDTEKAALNHRPICIDGIAIITNLDNPADSISSEAVTAIYIGDVTSWSDVS